MPARGMTLWKVHRVSGNPWTRSIAEPLIAGCHIVQMGVVEGHAVMTDVGQHSANRVDACPSPLAGHRAEGSMSLTSGKDTSPRTVATRSRIRPTLPRMCQGPSRRAGERYGAWGRPRGCALPSRTCRRASCCGDAGPVSEYQPSQSCAAIALSSTDWTLQILPSRDSEKTTFPPSIASTGYLPGHLPDLTITDLEAWGIRLG